LRSASSGQDLTAAQRKLLDLSTKIFDEPATAKNAAYFTARASASDFGVTP
jgi:hypothetical protein